MSSRCCTLPYNISRRSSMAPQRSTWTMDISFKVPCLLVLSSRTFWEKGGLSHRGVCEWYHPQPHVVPDFLTVSSKIRGKAARKHVCCAIWLSRGQGGGGVIEGTVSIVSISTPPCGSGWMDNIIPGKQEYKAWEGLEDQVYLQVHFTVWRWSLPRFAFMADSGLQLWSNLGVKFYYITLPSDTCSQKDKGGWTHKAAPLEKTQCCWLLVDNDQPEAFPLNISCYIFVGSQS